MAKYYLDTEFIEGPQKKRIFGIPYGETKPTIDLISIGIVSEDDREYYAISKDFNLKEAWNRWQQRTGCGDYNNMNPRQYWLRENVLKPIFDELLKIEYDNAAKALRFGIYIGVKSEFKYKTFKRLINKYGKTNKEIANEIKKFIGTKETIGNWDKVKDKMNTQFYADYCNYDWVVFCWLFGTMNDLPDGFPMYCNDLQQIKEAKILSYTDHFMNGDESLNTKWSYIQNKDNYPVNKNPHHALSDAKFDRDLHKFLNKL